MLLNDNYVMKQQQATCIHAMVCCFQEWTGEKELSDALLVTAERLPRAKFVITTLGRRGSVMLSRDQQQGQQQMTSGRELKEILSGLDKELSQASQADQEACVSRTGLKIRQDTKSYFPMPPAINEHARMCQYMA